MFILLPLVFTVFVNGQDSKESKYIDLLSDSDKEEFLINVARRISESVKVQNVSHKTSVEVSDDDLKSHDSFIKKILIDELNQRRNKGLISEGEDEINDDEKIINVNVKPLEKNINRLEDDNIDFTVRNERIKRRDIPSENDSKIPVEINNDSVEILTSTRTEGHQNAQEVKAEVHEVIGNKVIGPNKKSDVEDEPRINITENVDAEEITTIYDHTVDTMPTNSESGKKLDVVQNTNASTDLISTSKNIRVGHERRFGDEKLNAREEMNEKIISEIETTTTYNLNSSQYIKMETTLQHPDVDIIIKDVSNATGIETFTDKNTADSNSPNTEDDEVGKNIELQSEIAPKNLSRDSLVISNDKLENKINVNEKDVQIKSNLPDGGNYSNLVILRTNDRKVNNDYSKNSYTTASADTISSPVIDNIQEQNKISRIKQNKQTKSEFGLPKMTNSADHNTTNSYKNENHSDVAAMADKAVNFLRESLLMLDENKSQEKNSPEEILKGLQKEYSKPNNRNVKAYQVREIDADQLPFTENSLFITEKPYLVPVYNYSHNNAYYNPSNRYEPVSDEDFDKPLRTFQINSQGNNDIKIIKDLQKTPGKHFITFKDKSEDSFDNDENQRKKFDDIVYLKKKKNHKHRNHDNFEKITYYFKLPFASPQIKQKVIKYSPPQFNPNDYMDINYDVRMSNTGRSNNIKIPDSNEDSHPLHSLKKMKNHVRAVRNILYNNNIFPYPKPIEPETTTEAVRNTTTTTHHVYFRNGGDTSDIIALDYFFGRMKPQTQNRVNTKKNNAFFQLFKQDNTTNKNLMKYIYKSLNTEYAENYHTAATPHGDFMFEVESSKNSRVKATVNNIQILKRSSKDEDIVEDTEEKTSHGVNTIPKILDITDEKDVFVVLEMLQNLNISMSRRQDVNINVYLRVLKDMVYTENEALKKYDWLGTTVDILSALHKLLQLTEAAQNGEKMHPFDLELLRYTMFLHQLSDECLKSKGLATKLRKLLPKNKNRKPHFLTEKGLLNRVWLLRNTLKYKNEHDNVLAEFKQFLKSLQYGLYGLHKTLKNIAKVTRFHNQNWFDNIKESYLRKGNNRYMNLLLHIISIRVFSLIEESATKGVEKSFMAYLKKKKNKATAVRTVEEMVLVKKILEKLKIH